jgi:hypothetical protein
VLCFSDGFLHTVQHPDFHQKLLSGDFILWLSIAYASYDFKQHALQMDFSDVLCFLACLSSTNCTEGLIGLSLR